MPAPVVSWWNADNTTQQTRWDIGTVDAGKISAATTFLVWNNRSGASDVSDMQNATITTKAADTTDTGELVLNRWIEVKVKSLGEGSVNKIGYNATATPPGPVTRRVATTSSTTNADGTFTPGVAPHAVDPVVGTVDILGVKNSGDIASAKGNFVELVLQANVPTNASAGKVDFLTRISYQYV
ncbi:hypothetical protein [Peribacillus frigoritolerans]|uniref:Uncharacterized protein n=1 Tax=Peribacillus castrilensis TaxID=2897690 RepID=A0AAW9NP21_9BACI|nr:hypothetical protein [Peribacillus castrilensis]